MLNILLGNQMSSYAEALLDFYRGEVLGEAVYSALLESARNNEERLKLGTLLQLETETKAWLRAPMVTHGVSLEEPPAARAEGIEIAGQVKSQSWPELMETLRHVVATEFIPRYQSHADAAKARSRADEEAVCVYMVEHEKSQVEFAQRELAGSAVAHSLEPLVRFLKYPIKR